MRPREEALRENWSDGERNEHRASLLLLSIVPEGDSLRCMHLERGCPVGQWPSVPAPCQYWTAHQKSVLNTVIGSLHLEVDQCCSRHGGLACNGLAREKVKVVAAQDDVTRCTERVWAVDAGKKVSEDMSQL